MRRYEFCINLWLSKFSLKCTAKFKGKKCQIKQIAQSLNLHSALLRRYHHHIIYALVCRQRCNILTKPIGGWWYVYATHPSVLIYSPYIGSISRHYLIHTPKLWQKLRYSHYFIILIVMSITLSSLPLMRASFLFFRWDTAAIFSPKTIQNHIRSTLKFCQVSSMTLGKFIPKLMMVFLFFFFYLFWHSLFRCHLHLEEMSGGECCRISIIMNIV